MKLEKACNIFKLLSNPIRLNILKILSENDNNGICVSGIQNEINISQPNISQHLSILRNSGIVKCKKNGKKVCYTIIDEDVLKIVKNLNIEDLENFENDYDFEGK